MAVIAINGWNRLAVSFRTPVGGYVAGARGNSGTTTATAQRATA
jgi:hypothetical protein